MTTNRSPKRAHGDVSLVSDLTASIALLLEQLEPTRDSDTLKTLLHKITSFEKLDQTIAKQIEHAKKKKTGGTR
jgi:hypothetical protein